MSYKVKVGHNLILSLVDISPQPASQGIQPTRRSYAANGEVFDQARYVELRWNILENATAYLALLAQFGLSSTVSTAEVTVAVRDETYAFVNLNGTAVRPVPGESVVWEGFYPRNIVILVKDLETPA